MVAAIILIACFLLGVAWICRLLWVALNKDSLEEDLRTLWSHYTDETKTAVRKNSRSRPNSAQHRHTTNL